MSAPDPDGHRWGTSFGLGEVLLNGRPVAVPVHCSRCLCSLWDPAAELPCEPLFEDCPPQ